MRRRPSEGDDRSPKGLDVTTLNLGRRASPLLLLWLVAACDAGERSTIPGYTPPADEGDEGGEAPDDTPAVYDFHADSGLTLSLVTSADPISLTTPDTSEHVAITAVFELNGAEGLTEADLHLVEVSDLELERPIAIDVIRAYDGATAWLVPEALLEPGRRHRVHVDRGDTRHSQEFRSTGDLGRVVGAATTLQADASPGILRLTAAAAAHPSPADRTDALFNGLGVVASAGPAAVTLDRGSGMRGEVELVGFFADETNGDDKPDREDLAAGPLTMSGRVNGLNTRLRGRIGESEFLTLSGRLTRYEDGAWSLQGGVAIIDAPCGLRDGVEAQEVCDGERLRVVTPVTGDTIYFSPLDLADQGTFQGQGSERRVVVGLTTPWPLNATASDGDELDLSGSVRAVLLLGGEPGFDSRTSGEASPDLIAQTRCDDAGCALTEVGIRIGEAALPPGIATLRVEVGLRSATVPVSDGAPTDE